MSAFRASSTLLRDEEAETENMAALRRKETEEKEAKAEEAEAARELAMTKLAEKKLHDFERTGMYSITDLDISLPDAVPAGAQSPPLSPPLPALASPSPPCMFLVGARLQLTRFGRNETRRDVLRHFFPDSIFEGAFSLRWSSYRPHHPGMALGTTSEVLRRLSRGELQPHSRNKVVFDGFDISILVCMRIYEILHPVRSYSDLFKVRPVPLVRSHWAGAYPPALVPFRGSLRCFARQRVRRS